MPTAIALAPLPPSEGGHGLASHGYVEQEWLIGGRADALDPDGVCLAPAVPYQTRFVVRRPSDPSRVSGAVFLDALHMIKEMPASWDCRDWLMANGHVWVGVSIHNSSFGARYGFVGGVDALQEQDRSRYGGLHLPSFEQPPPMRSHPGPSGTDSFGLKWSMAMAHPQGHGIVADVAMVLRTRPELAELGARHLYACGVSQTANFWRLHLDGGWHDRRRLESGAPLFDAYVLLVSPAPAHHPTDAVLVNLLSEAEVVGTLVTPTTAPPDSEHPRVRGVELPGAPHTIGHAEVGDATGGHDHTAEPYVLVVNAALAGVDRWVRHGFPMPHVPRIARDPAAVDGVVRDEHGNAVGGVRVPWLEAPRAQYLPRCACGPTLGEVIAFDAAQLAQLYLDDADHEARWARAVARLVEDRLLLPEDVEVMIAHRSGSGGFAAAG